MSFQRCIARRAKRTVAPGSAAKMFLSKSLRSLSVEQVKEADAAFAGPRIRRETHVLFMLNCRVRWAALRCCHCGGLARSELPELVCSFYFNDGAAGKMFTWEFPGGLSTKAWARGWAADLQSWISLFTRRHQDCVTVATEDWPAPSPGHLADWGQALVVYQLKTPPAVGS